MHGCGAEKNRPGRTGEADSYRALAPGPRCTPITPNDQLSRPRSLLPSPRNKWKTQHTGNRHTPPHKDGVPKGSPATHLTLDKYILSTPYHTQPLLQWPPAHCHRPSPQQPVPRKHFKGCKTDRGKKDQRRPELPCKLHEPSQPLAAHTTQASPKCMNNKV